MRPNHAGSAPDPRIRRSWWTFAGAFIVVGLVLVARLLTARAEPLDWALAALVAIAAVAAIRYRQAVTVLEIGRRAEADSFARILSGLSRSVSEDAIVAAIMEELAGATSADHIVVARHRPEDRALQATLISARPGVPPSTTLLPLVDLELAGGTTGRRAPVAVPILPDLELVTTTEAAPGPVAARRPITAATTAATAGTADPADPAERGRPGSPGRGRGDGRLGGLGARLGRDRAPARVRVSVRGWSPDRDQASPALLDGGASAADRAAQVVAERIADHVRDAYGLTHMLTAPLRGPDGVMGAIVLSRRLSEGWSETSRRLLSGAAEEASVALSRAGSHRAAEVQASTDALTGLPNRRYFDEFCGLLARRRRAEDAVGVLMIDIDHFKVLNDTFGHATGDEVLRMVGAAIVRAVRDDDVPARYGGEEFVVLLRNPSGRIALEIGERVRTSVASLDLSSFGVTSVSVSVGVAVANRQDQPIPDLIKAADQALYRAKRAGRDRVVAA